LMCPFFFFSSRRRHTRSDRDWSSDVCSSDLPSKASSGDLTTYLQDSTGMRVRVMADATSGIAKPDLAKGRSYRLTGVVGQRASQIGRASCRGRVETPKRETAVIVEETGRV